MTYEHFKAAFWKEKSLDGKKRYHPLIFCGDFNSTPFSPLYEFLVTGHLQYEGIPQYNITGQGYYGGRILGKNLIPTECDLTDDCVYLSRSSGRRPPEASIENQFAGPSGQRPPETFTAANQFAGSSEQRPPEPSAAVNQFSDPVNEQKREIATNLSNSTQQSHGLIGTGLLTHAMNFLSVYEHFTRFGEQEVSTYHWREKTNVDYIFYSVKRKKIEKSRDGSFFIDKVEEDRIRLLERFALPSVREMNESVGKMPNAECPSDHLPLMAKFQLLL